MTRQQFKIITVPFYPVLGDVDKNLQRVTEAAKNILKSEADVSLLVFPELALSGYVLENLIAYAEVEPGDKRLKRLKKISETCPVIMGTVLLQNYHFYNSAFIFASGELKAIQKKIYLPTYGMFDESRYFSNGETLKTFDMPFGRCAVLICEDAWHPALAYSLYIRRVSHVFIISASPSREFHDENQQSFLSHQGWQKRLQVYAESFGQFYFYVNRSGVEDGVFFNGESFAVSPSGDVFQPVVKKEAYHVFSFTNEELISARMKGGPFHEENFTLNQKIIEESLREIYEQESN